MTVSLTQPPPAAAAAAPTPLEAGRRLLEDLQTVNRATVASADRVQILEQYRQASIVALEHLDAIYARAPSPLPANAREALALARSLSNELAIGYRTATAETLAQPATLDTKQRIPMLIYRAMEFAQEALRSGYRSHTPVPMGVWKALHELYLLAAQQGVAEAPADPGTEASVATLYSEAILMAVADPFGIGRDEIDRVRFHLRTTRAPVMLAQSRPATPPSAHFLVPCDTDKPPKPALSADDDRGGPNWRLLDANALVERLRARKLALESGHISQAALKALGPDAANLLGRLIVLWGDPPRRSSRREPMETSMALCVGLEALFHYVAREEDADISAEAKAIQSGRTLPLLWLGTQSVSKEFPVHEWDVVDASEGGFKVRRQRAGTSPMAVGDLVGIRKIAHQRWAVGIVRWTRTEEDGAFEAGLQLIAHAARCVRIQPTAGSVRASREALFLEQGLVRSSLPLLAPASSYSDLREFQVDDDGRLERVRAATLIERTASFEIFHVNPA